MSIIDLILSQISTNLPYGRVEKIGNNSIALVFNKDDLKKLFLDSLSRSKAKIPPQLATNFVEVEINSGEVKIILRLI